MKNKTDIDELKASFSKFDKDGSGTIDFVEIIRVFKEIGF